MAISDVIHRSLTGILDTFFLLTLKKQDTKLTLARSFEFYMKKMPWNHMERTHPFHNWKQKVNSKSPIFPAVDGFRLIGLSFRPDVFGVCLVSGSFA